MPNDGHIPRDFEWGCFKRVRDRGPLPWHEEHQHPASGITPSEYDVLRRLVREHRLETDYHDKFDMIIRAPSLGPPKPEVTANVSRSATGSPLDLPETPALRALRERRRLLGR